MRSCPICGGYSSCRCSTDRLERIASHGNGDVLARWAAQDRLNDLRDEEHRERARKEWAEEERARRAQEAAEERQERAHAQDLAMEPQWLGEEQEAAREAESDRWASEEQVPSGTIDHVTEQTPGEPEKEG